MNVISLVTPKIQVAYLYDDCTIRQALEGMRARGYTAVPVLTREGKYVGTVSEGDFLWKIVESGDSSLRSLERRYLKELVRPGFNPAVNIRVTMQELLERATGQNFVPVVDDRDAFVGIVTRKNILRKLTVPSSCCSCGKAEN